jgi:G:T-mismatch repair DNA endonuclease (very short patch repair protein)
MKRPEVRAKRHEWDQAHPEQAAATRRALLEGHQRLERSKPSNLEHRLRGYLDDLGISYEPAAMIKPGFIVDIRIGRLILQADGDYWHGHLRFEPLTERQQKQRSRDKAQDAYLRACGYAVVRIWECEMSFDLVRRILEEHAILPAEASA